MCVFKEIKMDLFALAIKANAQIPFLKALRNWVLIIQIVSSSFNDIMVLEVTISSH